MGSNDHLVLKAKTDLLLSHTHLQRPILAFLEQDARSFSVLPRLIGSESPEGRLCEHGKASSQHAGSAVGRGGPLTPPRT